MGETARKTDPELWQQVKDEVTESDKGGRPGQWSARKAQLAVQEYKRRGGGYDEESGPDKEETHLQEWTEQDWDTASGERSRDTGERYLPDKAREALSEEEYRRSSEKKRKDLGRGKQFSQQPADIQEKTAPYTSERTKAELYERAQELDISGRSRMTKEELRRAVNTSEDARNG